MLHAAETEGEESINIYSIRLSTGIIPWHLSHQETAAAPPPGGEVQGTAIPNQVSKKKIHIRPQGGQLHTSTMLLLS